MSGKKIRCPECSKVLTVPGQKKTASTPPLPNKRQQPPPDPWDEDEYLPLPSYEQPQQYRRGVAPPSTRPRRRNTRSSQSSQQITKFVGIALVVVCFGGAAILGMYAMKNREKYDTPENERARVMREVGRGQVSGQTYTNKYFNLSVTFPRMFKLLDEAETNSMSSVYERKNSGGAMSSQQKSIAARELFLMVAFNMQNPLADEPESAVIVLTQRIGNAPGIETPKKFLNMVRKNHIVTDPRNSNVGTAKDGSKLGSLDAATLEYSANAGFGKKRYFRLYTTRVGDYYLTFLVAWTKKNSLRELERIIRSVKASD